MNRIEEQMVKAIKERRDVRIGNTEVIMFRDCETKTPLRAHIFLNGCTLAVVHYARRGKDQIGIDYENIRNTRALSDARVAVLSRLRALGVDVRRGKSGRSLIIDGVTL